MKTLSGLSQVAAVLILTALVSACGDDAQQRYDRATEALAEAREQRSEAMDAMQDKEKELEEYQDNLNESEERLQEAREQLQAAEAKVNASVNDEVLFRTLQRKLLNEDRFGDAAIAVGVADRVVTLTGTVPDKATHKAAIKTAEGQSGVEEVVDFLEIEGKASKKKAADKK